MAKILVTGMTSPQSSRRLNSRSVAFSGALASIAESGGHEVNLTAPSARTTLEDLRQYDSIVIGLTSPLSVTANFSFGALVMIGRLIGDKRLSFLIDTDLPGKISAGIRSLQKDRDQLIKPFYSTRREYKDFLSDASLQSFASAAIDFLGSDTASWPMSVFPALPWSSAKEVEEKLPKAAAQSLYGITVDSFFVEPFAKQISDVRQRQWVIDSDKTKWSKSVTATLAVPHVKMKQKRSASDSEVSALMSSSLGVLISPNDDGMVPWSHRWAQALNHTTPIASDWKITSVVGESWSHLPAGIEDMGHIDRYELAIAQKQEYSALLPKQDTVRQTLKDILRIA